MPERKRGRLLRVGWRLTAVPSSSPLLRFGIRRIEARGLQILRRLGFASTPLLDRKGKLYVTTLLALTLVGGCTPRAAGTGGIVSTDACADAMLVELAPWDRIAAISRESSVSAATSVPPDIARHFPVTNGTADVIARRPDLVVISAATPASVRETYRRARLRVLVLDRPRSVAGSEAQIMQLADALDLHARGIAMVRRIEIALAAASPALADTARPSALLYLAGNLVAGDGSLLDELLRRTGFRNAAGSYGLRGSGTLPIQAIIDAPPDVILMPSPKDRPSALRADVLQYRTQLALFPSVLEHCGGPVIGRAAATLAAIRRKVVR